jgi:WD40 repeat protein
LAAPKAAGALNIMVFAPDGKTLATGTNEGVIQLWDVPSGRERPQGLGGMAAFRWTGWSHEGRVLAAVQRAPAVRLWDVPAGKERADLIGHQREISGLAFTADDLTLGTASHDGTAKLWDVTSGQLLATLPNGQPTYGLAFVRDSKRVFTWNTHGVASWDVATGQAQGKFPLAPGDALSAGAMTADNKTLAVATWNEKNGKAVAVWDAATGRPRATFALPGNSAGRLGFSPDGRFVAAEQGYHAGLLAWDLGTNKERVNVPTGQAWSLAPDSQSLIVASGTAPTLQVWDLPAGKLRFPLEGHTKLIQWTSYSPDGRLVASVGLDGRVIIWEPAARKRKVREWQFPGAVLHVAFAPDGRHLSTVNGNGSVYVLRLSGPMTP